MIAKKRRGVRAGECDSSLSHLPSVKIAERMKETKKERKVADLSMKEIVLVMTTPSGAKTCLSV